ncbi:hypothetical protein A1O7_07507 [Cladophialophora yegresii CBS 114405]|uniref:Uncharacterized protein n=1 Tax=Cladophialophora yegresii CBS 114405 TaxID=1182544 RepID=W9VY46_9EURO|nr:uncharacterized protein A1O7_07507 [Cladophialophora yegresii CBS 114405]EXJ57161.1 hypothetical protein A1O7_07507 [Cladophialophora yegresii CBS 114405]
MSFFTSNRFLVVVIFLGLGSASVLVPALLTQVRDAAKAPAPDPPPPPQKTLQKDSENALNIDTLRTLADGYSYDLRNSAIKIVASRTARSRARDLLLRDLASRNYERRQDAINALHLLLNNNSFSVTICDQFRDAKSVAAVVKALINVLPQHSRRAINLKAKAPDEAGDEKRLPPSPIRPEYRPSQEQALISLLTNMLCSQPRRGSKYAAAMDAALQAGLVTKWLAKYPFPCSQPENSGFNYKRSDVAFLFDRMAWMSDDPLMADVIITVMQYPMGRKQMRQVGLSASSVRENVNGSHWTRDSWNWVYADDGSDEDEDNDVRMINGEDTAGTLFVPDNITLWDEPTGRPTTRAGARLRSAERSQEEEHLRRRHREAIVVAERGTPLRRENILQRQDSQILQPMNGLSDVEGELNGLLGLSENRAEAAQRDQGLDGYPDHETPEVLDPVAEAEVASELRALEEAVAREEAEESNRAQSRHREMEHLIEHDPEIQGTNEAAQASAAGTSPSPDPRGLLHADPSE